MMRIFGSTRQRNDGISRRALLQTGALGLCGLAGSDAIRQSAGAESLSESLPGYGRAKRVLVLYIYGAWSQLETFDPKPEAPEAIRGEFGSIESCLPGIRVCEHLPELPLSDLGRAPRAVQGLPELPYVPFSP